jgi:MFS family permease
VVQGLCLGGELPGALTYVVETAPRAAPLVCGVVFACVTVGVAIATGVSVGLRTFLPPALVPVYGWRLAFVLGGLGGALSFVLRRSLEESPEFSRMKQFAVRQPFREVLATHPRQVLVGIATLAGTACFNGLFFSHLPRQPAASSWLAGRPHASRRASCCGPACCCLASERIRSMQPWRRAVHRCRCCSSPQGWSPG